MSVLPVTTDRFLKLWRLQKNLRGRRLRLRCSLRTVVFLVHGRPLFCRANGPAARRQKPPNNLRGEHSDPFRRLRLTVVSCSPPSAPHASPRRGDNRHPHTIVRAPSALYLLRDKVLGAARREGVSATGCDRLLASITSSTRRSRRSRGVRPPALDRFVHCCAVACVVRAWGGRAGGRSLRPRSSREGCVGDAWL